ncbi:MAG: hypothetical protein WCQ95_00595 [Bacteroidota bacterium]
MEPPTKGKIESLTLALGLRCAKSEQAGMVVFFAGVVKFYLKKKLSHVLAVSYSNFVPYFNTQIQVINATFLRNKD